MLFLFCILIETCFTYTLCKFINTIKDKFRPRRSTPGKQIIHHKFKRHNQGIINQSYIHTDTLVAGISETGQLSIDNLSEQYESGKSGKNNTEMNLQ